MAVRQALDRRYGFRRAVRVLSAAGVRTGAKLLVSAGLLCWIASRFEVSAPAFPTGADALLAIFLVWLIQSALPFVQALRWRVIATTLGVQLPYREAVKNVYVGQFFNQVLPSSIGGDAVRIWRSTRLMPLSSAISSVALDRFVALLAVPIILTVGSGMLSRIVPPGPLRWSLYAVVAGAGCGALLLLFADRIPLLKALFRLPLISVLQSLPEAARRLAGDPGCLLRSLGLSIVIHLGVGTSLCILARSLGIDAPLASFLLLAPLVTMVTTAPMSVAGWGVREGAMITALGLLGVPASAAFNISIQFGLVMLVVGLPGGVVAFFSPAPEPQLAGAVATR